MVRSLGHLGVEALGALPTLRGLVLECLRLYPAAFAIYRTAARDFEFAGHHVDADDYFGRLPRGDYDAVLSGGIADSGDPREFLHSSLHSRSILDPKSPNPSANNLARWRDDVTDDMIAKIGEGSQGRHSPEIAALLHHVGDQAPILPLMYGPSVTVLSRRVRAFRRAVAATAQIVRAASCAIQDLDRLRRP